MQINIGVDGHELLSHPNGQQYLWPCMMLLTVWFKCKADENFNHSHIPNIPRIKIFIQRRSWAKRLF